LAEAIVYETDGFGSQLGPTTLLKFSLFEEHMTLLDLANKGY